jgi:cobalt-zinc-cadmium efflux system membrane fusion protein
MPSQPNKPSRFLVMVLWSSLLLYGCGGSSSTHDEADGNRRVVGETPHDIQVVTLKPKQVALAGIKSIRVQCRSMDLELTLNGEVAFDKNRLMHITPRVSGVVKDIWKTVGDRVEVGDVLIVLRSQELATSKSDYLAARQRLILARKNFARLESLRKDRIAAEQEYLDAQQALAEANIVSQTTEQALYTLGLSRQQVEALPKADPVLLSRYEVEAPLAGTLVEQHAAPGDRVQSDTALFVLTPIETLWVMASVYEEDVARIALGQSGRVTVQAYPDRQFPGTVTWIADAMDTQTRTLQIRLQVSNEQRLLKAGMFATVVLIVDKRHHVLTIPVRALQTEPNSTYVFVEVGPGQYERRPIVVGLRSERAIEVKDGLSEEDRIVTDGTFILKSELEKGSFGDVD